MKCVTGVSLKAAHYSETEGKIRKQEKPIRKKVVCVNPYFHGIPWGGLVNN